MGHWTNSSQQTLSAASGIMTVVDFDEELISGSQTALQDGVYDYSYHLNIIKPSGEIGPSRMTSVLAVRREVGGIDIIRQTRSFSEIDSGAEEVLSHVGQLPLSSGDMIIIRVNLDDSSQSGMLNTRLKKQQCTLSLDLIGASASGNFAGTVFPTAGLLIGQEYYRTDLLTPFRWTGQKWLGDMIAEGAGRSSTQDGNAYLRRYNGMIEGPQKGGTIPFDATIVGFSWNMSSGVLGNFEVRRNGIAISNLVVNNQKIGNIINLNDDFDANGIMSVFWQSSFSCNNPQVTVYYRRRG